MNTTTCTPNLTNIQENHSRPTSNKRTTKPDTKGWIHLLMQILFINDYRKIVRGQCFPGTADSLYRLSLPCC